MTLYNEIEPYAAQWLRNLSATGHIAEGTVDERSIRDLRPSDIARDRQFHTFAGIGIWSRALRDAGVPDDFPVWTGSGPCQPFSQAGAGGGFDDPRHLWPEWFRLIRECRPPLIFGEQVASPDGLAWLDAVQADLEGAGYAFGAFDLSAAGFGAPHIRQRLYFVAYTDENGWRERWRAERHTISDVGDTEEVRRGSGRAGETIRDARESHRSGSNRFVADDESGRRGEGCLPEDTEREHRTGSADGCGVGDADERSGGRDDRRLSRSQASDERGVRRELDGSRDAGADGRMGDADPARRAGIGHVGEPPERSRRDTGPELSGSGSRGATGGFWNPCDWIPCRDPQRGIVYRPVEPGTFPLAHGYPARVGKLRAYGNAIVRPQAAEFIRCALDAILEG